MNMMISYQELVRTFPGTVISEKSRIPKRRPWVVVGPEHGEYSTYSTLDKAATAFFERLSLIASGLEDN